MNEEQEQPKKKKDPIWKHARIGVPKYKTPDELWNDALRYFQWCDDNPVDAPISVIKYKKEKHGGSKEMKKQDQQENVTRPYTLYGFCAFTGIAKWNSFKFNNKDRDGFEEVIMAIENVIASQQLDGAMTGVFKENLTARLNGLADKQQTDTDVEITMNSGEQKKFTGFSFVPHTDGLINSDASKVASGEVVKELPQAEPERVIDYAEIVDYSDVTASYQS